MIRKLNLKEKNKIDKTIKNFKTRMAVYIYIYIVYCHLENKRDKKLNIINRDRTMVNLKISIGLSLSAFVKGFRYKEKRAGPLLNFRSL